MPQLRPLLLCALFATVAFSPALFNAGLPDGADIAIHYWRTFDLAHSWSYADLTARWSELYYYGYGAPSFQYTGMGLYALAALVGEIPFVDDVARLKLVWWLGLFLASWGMWRYVSRQQGEWAGYVSAAAFVFAPVLIFHEPMARGSLGVVLGMGCLALCLSFLDEIAHTGRGIIGAALSLLGLLLAHNLTAVAGGAILGGWLLWNTLFSQSEKPFLRRAWGAFFLGCGLSAFFWIPVALERDLVRVGTMGTNDHLDFRRQFQALGVLLAFPQPFDTTLWNNAGHPQLGFFQWLLGLIGSVWLLVDGASPQRREVLFWVIVASASILVMLPQGAFLWEQIPLLQQFLFPLRFLNTAVFALAILCGLAISAIGKRDNVYALIMILLFVAQGLHTAAWTWREFPSEATVSAYFDYEKNTGVLGGTADNEFLPPTVRDLPGTTDFLLESLDMAQPTQRINTFTLPENVTLEVLNSSPSRYSFLIDTPEPLTLEVLQFHFSGWEAYRNNEPLPMRINDPYGFIMLDIPAGQHTIEIIYPLTLVQQIGAVATLISMVMLLVVARLNSGSANAPDHAPASDWRILSLLLVGLLALTGLHGLRILGYTTSPAGEAHRAAQSLVVEFGEEATFLGYELQPSLYNQIWRVDIYWHFPTEQINDLNGWVHLLDENGVIIAQNDKLAINAPAQTEAWNTTWQLRDDYILIADAPVSTTPHSLRIGLWRCLDEVNDFGCSNREGVPITTPDYDNPDGWFVIDH